MQIHVTIYSIRYRILVTKTYASEKRVKSLVAGFCEHGDEPCIKDGNSLNDYHLLRNSFFYVELILNESKI